MYKHKTNSQANRTWTGKISKCQFTGESSFKQIIFKVWQKVMLIVFLEGKCLYNNTNKAPKHFFLILESLF